MLKLVRSCLGYILLWLKLALGFQTYQLLFVRNNNIKKMHMDQKYDRDRTEILILL